MLFDRIALLALLATSCAPPSQVPQPQRSVPTDTMIDVGGHRLHFRIWQGDPHRVVVLEAGGGSDMSTWDTVPSMLARAVPATILAYDRAGLGQSEAGPAGLTPADEMDQLHRALVGLGARHTLLVSHSFGGMLSFYYLLRHPEQVAGMVLVDPMNPLFVQQVTFAWLNRTVPDIPNPQTPRDRVIVRMKQTMPGLVDETAGAVVASRTPMIVITAGVPWWGDSTIDQAWRKSHEDIVAERVNRRLVIAPRSRHGIPASDPELIVQAVQQLLPQ
jgi:pimeloyl-ACP methyl ester carboxylesterase